MSNVEHPVCVEPPDGTHGYRAWLGTETKIDFGVVGEEDGPNATAFGAVRALASLLGNKLDSVLYPPPSGKVPEPKSETPAP